MTREEFVENLNTRYGLDLRLLFESDVYLYKDYNVEDPDGKSLMIIKSTNGVDWNTGTHWNTYWIKDLRFYNFCKSLLGFKGSEEIENEVKKETIKRIVFARGDLGCYIVYLKSPTGFSNCVLGWVTKEKFWINAHHGLAKDLRAHEEEIRQAFLKFLVKEML